MKISPGELDPFIMKGITFFRKEKLPIPNFRKLPIQIKVEDSVTTLLQTICPLPGEKYVLTGSFKHSPNSKYSMPLNFRLISRSNQTAYPHPTQGLGLPFCDILVPPLSGKPNKTPKFCALITKKVTFARLLFPGRKLNNRAKEQYAARQNVFSENKKIILNAHKNLIGHFVEKDILDPFYNSLFETADPYQMLSKTLKLYGDLFLKKLKMVEDPEVMQNEGRARLNSKLIIPQPPLKEALFRFVLALDKALTKDLSALVISKTLTDHQKTLQILALKQLTTFLDELEHNKPITLATFLDPIQENHEILRKGTLSKEWIALSAELN